MKKISKPKHIILLVSLLINLIFLFITLFFCSPKYEVSDDFMVDAVLSGAYGYGLNEHLLFQNIILGYILKGLYNIIPGISWYFVMQIFLCFLALTSVTYVILSNNHRFIGVILSIIFVAVFSEDVYILVNFTKTAGLVTTAGGALFLYSFWNLFDNKNSKLKKILLLCFSILLTLFGFMFRMNCIYLSLLIWVPLFFYYVVKSNQEKNHPLQKILLRIAICLVSCGILVLSTFIIYKFDNFFWSKIPEYESYKVYNPVRANVTDIRTLDYGSYEDTLNEIDYDINDFQMIRSWNFLDQDYFTVDKLTLYSNAKKIISKDYSRKFSNIIDEISNRKYLNYRIIWGIIIITLIALFLYPQKIIWFLLSDIFMIGILIYFFIRGRVLYRIDYSVIASTAIVLCHMYENKEAIDKKLSFPLLTIASIIILFKLTTFIPDAHYKYQSDSDYRLYMNGIFSNSSIYDSRKYRINISKKTPYDDIIEYIQNDTENYYLLDFNTCIQNLYYNYIPWKRVPEGIFSNCSFLGGVTTQYPDNNRSWADHGIDTYNPYLSIVNDNIYVIDNYNQNTKLDYLRKMYYPNAWMELINEIDGFKIWKFHKE